MAQLAGLVGLDATVHGAGVTFCKAQTIGLVVIGPEAPLVGGLADSLRAADVPVFGPGQQAAQLEGSKGFTKDLCGKAGIPTAGYVRAKSEAERSEEHTSELQSLMRISYAVFCLQKKKFTVHTTPTFIRQPVRIFTR